MVKKIIQGQKGFSLIEVMIALTIFGVYVTAMIISQSNNVGSSIRMAQDLVLHNLAEMKMSEALLGDKEFSETTENDIQTGTFDIEGFKTFKYKISFKKTEFPDFSQIMGQSDDEDGDNKSSAVQKLIFEKMKKNVEEILWQIKVEVINSDTEQTYELNSWVNKSNAKIDTNFSF
ncbi:MAG: prepilin-type N-terminal cleavage/methylation domain-containing protein [Bacteriovoracaceae bacterium]|jgi:prepilin-type N-terminal cleavage/methylation domain-containing protein